MIKSQLEIIEQAQSYLNQVSQEDYTAIISPNFISSAGSHIRHIIDHYLALMSGLHNNEIDYDKRGRGSSVELHPTLAIDKLNEISDWIKSLSERQLNTLLPLKTEVSMTSKNVQTVQTSIARELVFVGSHAVHHYAMIAQISFAQTKALPQTFGLAPATVSYMRAR
ncbi:DinB family protein [Colwellia sp. 4_MG-2023]|uniref:DinB family protein n=1 Tax=unclassified Colwellia TaxID=196834 RepID=UPI001C089F95|nr:MULTISPECIES: DinB family protein [unclassified Colwellia]MBU2923451.1 hypothetical protein [Colwellia sp. C2M11]MDO6489080.1 DinB family protein [Colwellia sp. 6_MG-2023]MDO6508131.1 DinB family protein [Colwellia sp. 5_MG-2023]MDO6556845.1 DinB family protein [Colwellia sp. 4_MG-2023]MDO6653811.1 DinB family protein [Colwellia sp. 3_MG-2023]